MANWDKRFMDLARHIAEWSKDTNTKVGAVIVDEDNTILSVGYNGFPRGADDNIAERYERPLKYIFTEHSERNAIFNAVRSGINLKGGKMYVTMAPCHECARAIINSGIKTVVTYEPEFGHERWGESFRASIQMFKECGVNVIYFSDEHDEFYFNFIDKTIEVLDFPLLWDYRIANGENLMVEHGAAAFFGSQKDWNQTLMVKINQSSALILKGNQKSGANKIRCNVKSLSLILDLEYYNKESMILAGKYQIIVDNKISKDELIVYYDGRHGVGKKEESSNYLLIEILNHK